MLTLCICRGHAAFAYNDCNGNNISTNYDVEIDAGGTHNDMYLEIVAAKGASTKHIYSGLKIYIRNATTGTVATTVYVSDYLQLYNCTVTIEPNVSIEPTIASAFGGGYTYGSIQLRGGNVFKPCDASKTWDGFYIDHGGSLFSGFTSDELYSSNLNEIDNAVKGIDLEVFNNSITYTKFKNCTTSINIASWSSSTDKIYANTFVGDAITPTNTTGINISSVVGGSYNTSFVSIGDPTKSANTFTDCSPAIMSSQSSATLQNATISYTTASSTNIGVEIYNNSSVGYYTQIGGTATNAGLTISNAGTGVLMQNIEGFASPLQTINILYNTITNSATGILFQGTRLKCNATIDHNTVQNFISGIQFNTFIHPATKVDITNSTLTNSSTATSTTPIVGVSIYNTSPRAAYRLSNTISNNTISYCDQGISVTNNAFTITDNIITHFMSHSSTTDVFAGINLLNSSGAIIRGTYSGSSYNQKITGTAVPAGYSGQKIYNIYMSNSQDVVIQANQLVSYTGASSVSTGSYGIYAYGMANDLNLLCNNYDQYIEKAHDLYDVPDLAIKDIASYVNSGSTNNEASAENYWGNGISDDRVNLDGSSCLNLGKIIWYTPQPGSGSYDNTTLDKGTNIYICNSPSHYSSFFTINRTNQTSTCTSTITQLIAAPICSGSNCYTVFNGGGGVLGGGIGCTGCGNNSASFAMARSGYLQNVVNGSMVGAGQSTAQQAQIQHFNDRNLYNVFNYSADVTWTNLGTSDDAAYANYYSTLQSSNVGYADAFYAAIDIADYATANHYLGLYSATNSLETNEYLVMYILNNHYSSGSGYTSTQLSQLSSLAHLNSLCGGRAVAQARAILGISMFEPACSGSGKRDGVENNKVMSNTAAFNLYPNPANNNLNVICNIPDISNTYITIADNTGRLIYTLQLSTPSQTIDISKLPAGIYYTQMVQNNRVINRNKFVVIH